jgi:hypothetical protein
MKNQIIQMLSQERNVKANMGEIVDCSFCIFGILETKRLVFCMYCSLDTLS